MEIQDILKQVGEISNKPTQFILTKLNESGILVNDATQKIISILVFVSLIYVFIAFLNQLNKIVKFIIVGLLISAIIGIILSF